MTIFGNFSSGDATVASLLANAAYDGEPLPAGWSALAATELSGHGLTAGDFDGIYFDGAEIIGWGAAQALVVRNGSNLAISFRGTDRWTDFLNYPDLYVGNNYLNAFTSLLNAVKSFAQAEGIPASNIIITGHSLGGGGVNNLRNASNSSFGGFYDTSKYIAFATPFVASRPDILNFGFENDPIFQVDSGDHASRTDNLVFFDDAFAAADWPGTVFSILQEGDRTAHSIDNYVAAVSMLASSTLLSETSIDSIIIFDSTSGLVQDKNTSSALGSIFGFQITDHQDLGAILIGQDAADTHRDSILNDIFEMRGGDDIVYLTSGNDRVLGGTGDDTVVIEGISRADAAVAMAGATRTITSAEAGTKTLTDVETVIYTGLSDVGSNALLPFGANVLFRNDDSSSPFINLASIFEQGIDFNGNEFTGLYVNTNGNVTFEGPLGQFTPAVIGNGSQTIIAPFWGDVDTRLPSTGTNGNVYWDFNTQRDSFVVTWSNVGYYDTHVDKLNTFQLELVDQGGGNFEIIYRFADINWTTGDASGGTEGLGGTVARSGFSSGNGLYFELPGSGNQTSVLNWENAPGNTGVSGVWQFQVMSGALQNVGSSGDDTFTGGNGDDYYFGGAGNDSCIGGLGNDRFYGGEGDDYLFGGDGDDWIDGGIGFDWLVAGSGAGNDHYDGGDDADVITFTSTTLGIVVNLAAGTASGQEIGTDVIVNVEHVIGGRGSDSLIGNDLANALTGGRGKDRLEGGADADIFDFDHKLDSKKGGQRDVIADFERGLDHIDLSTIDAVKGAGDQAFKWIGKKDFTGKAGELHFVKKGGGLIVEGDIDGNGKADFQIQLNDLGGIGKGDFIL